MGRTDETLILSIILHIVFQSPTVLPTAGLENLLPHPREGLVTLFAQLPHPGIYPTTPLPLPA